LYFVCFLISLSRYTNLMVTIVQWKRCYLIMAFSLFSPTMLYSKHWAKITEVCIKDCFSGLLESDLSAAKSLDLFLHAFLLLTPLHHISVFPNICFTHIWIFIYWLLDQVPIIVTLYQWYISKETWMWNLLIGPLQNTNSLGPSPYRNPINNYQESFRTQLASIQRLPCICIKEHVYKGSVGHLLSIFRLWLIEPSQHYHW
jgi:hypothetical protein